MKNWKNAVTAVNNEWNAVNNEYSGNQLYLSLSQLTRRSFLMQTELPTLLNVFEAEHELQYSESYTASRQK